MISVSEGVDARSTGAKKEQSNFQEREKLCRGSARPVSKCVCLWVCIKRRVYKYHTVLKSVLEVHKSRRGKEGRECVLGVMVP